VSDAAVKRSDDDDDDDEINPAEKWIVT